MRIVYFSCHSILEYDDLSLLHGLGHEVFSLGGFIDPAHPHDQKRPALPQIPEYPELRRAVDALNQPDNLDAAKFHTPNVILDWAEAIIVTGFEWKWIVPQWERIKHKRVIWRTIGQTSTRNEELMAPLFREGLEIVRYSPKERHIPGYAGESAVIRFYKDSEEWTGWTGENAVVTNVTQQMFQRPGACNAEFFMSAMHGLTADIAGEGSEIVGGRGQIAYEDMKQLLRTSRAMLYTGTLPAPYTLGFMEAAMTGTPIVSIGHLAWASQAHSIPDTFEADEIAWRSSDNPMIARSFLRSLLNDLDLAKEASRWQQRKARELFSRDRIAAQWAAFLDGAAEEQAAA